MRIVNIIFSPWLRGDVVVSVLSGCLYRRLTAILLAMFGYCCKKPGSQYLLQAYLDQATRHDSLDVGVVVHCHSDIALELFKCHRELFEK